MASQVRYLVTFLGSAGVHQAADTVALDADTYARERDRKPKRLIRLVEEWHEELDGNRVEIPGSKRIVVAPPEPVAADLEGENAKLKADIVDIIARAQAAANEGNSTIRDLQAKNDELAKRLGEAEKKLAKTKG